MSPQLGAAARRPRGQTLVEVMVAMAVLGIGLVAIMEAFSTCAAAVEVIRGEVVARDFASRMMSELRITPSLLSAEESGDVGPEYPGFVWRRQLRETRDHGVLAVRVTVEWRCQGMRRQYVLETLVATPRI